MKPEQQTEYIVQCIREGGSMYEDDARKFLAEHGAHVLAERDMEIVRWLGKKAREYRATGRKADASRADLLEKMASQITRGAVRPNNTLLPAGVRASFFEPGRRYVSGTWEFRCETTSPSPTTGERRALGWVHKPGYGWYPTALDPDDWEHGGWTEDTEGGEPR